MTVTNDIKYIGVNDHQVDLFEGQYVVPNGMAYNSYAILDEKIAVMDTVDKNFTHEWMDNLQSVLAGRKPDYLVVQHMEPDHSANIDKFLKFYPETVVVSSAKAFAMMKNFFGTDYADRRIIVGEGDTLSLGKHTLTFVTAPMVHWPEVIVTYDSYDKVLFSADRWMWRRIGPAKPGGTTLVLWASTVPRCRHCLRRLPVWTSGSLLLCTVLS